MTFDASDDWPRTVAIVGVGLLGGSVSLAIKRARPGVRTIGVGRSQESCQRLLKHEVVDQAVTSLEAGCREADAVILATPVDKIASLAIEVAALCPKACLITDVGSTKLGIVRAVTADPQAASRFVAAHPIAGSEKSGCQYASADLMQDKVIVLTPHADCDVSQVARAERFWSLTGGRIEKMSPQRHDALLAAVSHVPHLVSALVARRVSPDSLPLVGSGWRDITRVAAGDPGMWTAICQENREAIREELAQLSQDLAHLRDLLDQQDDAALHRWLAEAKRLKQETI